MNSNEQTQAQWIERAQQVLPAGGFGNFDASVVIKRGLGSHVWDEDCLLYTSPSPRDATLSRMPSSA